MWLETIKKSLDEIGMSTYFSNPHNDEKEFISKKAFKKREQNFNTESLNNIKKNKLRTYALFKDKSGFESYLVDIKNTDLRKQVTKFRLSDHKLRIETGRYENLSAEVRFCPFCPDKVECETHMLLACPIYNHKRNILFNYLIEENNEFTSYSETEKLVYIMKNISQTVAKYISNCFEIRTFLLSKARRHD